MRELDLAWFEVVLIGNKFLSGEDEPYWLVTVWAHILRYRIDS